MAKQKFELLQAVWTSGTEQLAAGTTVTFENDEPTGIFIGRVKELTSGGDAIEVASPAPAAEPEPTPPAPPGARK